MKDQMTVATKAQIDELRKELERMGDRFGGAIMILVMLWLFLLVLIVETTMGR